MITDKNGTVQEQNDYYPYGGRHTSGNIYALLPGNNHKFNGKEEQTTGNLGYLDYGARMYDNVTGRWGTPDPLAEKYKSMSPYNYCGNNPVINIDPDGKAWDIFWDVGNVLYDTGAAIYQHVKGNHEQAKSYWKDAGYDLLAAAIPFVPAGATKAVKGAGKVINVVKGVDKVGDVGKTTNKVVESGKTYQTYTKMNPKTGEVYSGRTSGKLSPEQNVSKRDQNHHMNEKGFGRAVLDKSSSNPNAIRGREQFLIDQYGGAKSMGGTSGNSINGISPVNLKKDFYIEETHKTFKSIK